MYWVVLGGIIGKVVFDICLEQDNDFRWD